MQGVDGERCRIEFGARMREEDDIAPLHDVCGRWALQRDG